MNLTTGDALNARVWRLFRRAGFQTRPNDTDPTEETISLPGGQRRPVDLVATVPELEVTIVGQNTTAVRLDSAKSAEINDLAELVRARQANAGLFVWTQIQVAEEDNQYARSKQITIWDLPQLEYYEALADAIHEYAKYEIIHALGITTTEEASTFETLALKLNQPNRTSGIQVFAFVTTPDRLLKTCVVYRRAQGDASAYQRMLQKSRLPKIKKFISSSGAVLPTNIIVHFGDQVRWESPSDWELHGAQGRRVRLTRPNDSNVVILSIPDEYASLELIDGQHRLYGFVEAHEDVRRNFNIIVTGLVDLDQGQRRDLFVSINDNSRRMDPNLVAYLKYTEDEEQCSRSPELMAIKIAVALNQRDSVLRDRIKLLDVGSRPVSLKGLSGYDLRSLVGPRGLLRRYYGSTSEEYIRALKTYFSAIRNVFGTEWDDPRTYILCSNRGVSAMLKLLKSMLRTENNALDFAGFRRYLDALRQGWPTKDWKLATLRGRYSGSGGWKDFHRD